MFTTEYYPQLEIARNIKANRFYAFPLLGFLTKIIFLIPVGLWLVLLYLASFILGELINSFIVLFTGKYWQSAYQINLYAIKMMVKTTFYLQGLTDKYPGFGNDSGDFKLEIAYPGKPSRFYAIPLLGGLVRIILLIPYIIFQQVIGNGANVGVFFSFAKVLFKGEYPESTYEFARDSVRISQAPIIYLSGLSDKYPSFQIDLKHHQVIKIILIIIGALSLFSNLGSSRFNQTEKIAPPATNIQINNIINNTVTP